MSKSKEVTFQMFINANEVPLTGEERTSRLRALERGEREARRQRSVTIAEQHGDEPPYTLASWVDGEKSTG